MKKLNYLIIVALTFALTSCSKDDDNSDKATIENQIKYDGKTIDLGVAIIEDYGVLESSESELDKDYYNYDFVISGTAEEQEYMFYAELLSPSVNNTFKPGTFVYDGLETESAPDFFYTVAFLKVDNTEINVVGGDILVSGTGTNFTISGTLTLENDKTLKISYSGSFEILDETEE